jgi:hypothetical protein
MADNVILPGSGEPIATDEIGTSPSNAHYQRIKLTDGLADSTTPMRVRADSPLATDGGAVVRQAPCDIWSVGFADVGSGLLASELVQRRLGTGMGVTQGSSNLLVTTGTTANSEFLARSVKAFRGALIARHKTILSQRIANQNFIAMLADVIGEGLSCTINSATSITVTLPAHGLTAANVGQSMFVGAITGATGVPGRYAIASVPSADTINFTVSGWPSSGSCTVDLFGWNYIRTLYAGTTATSAAVDAQRRGWNSGDTTATINSTTSPGHVMQVYADGRNITWADTLVASGITPTVTTRASRIENIPDDDVELHFYLWSFNGSTAPASTTTWTIGFVAVEDMANVPTFIAGVRPLGGQAPLPVSGTFFQATQPVSGTVTATVSNATIAAGTAAIGDVGVQYRASSTGAATLTNVNCPATPVAQQIRSGAGRLVGMVLTNTAASARWIKVFNALSASVTPGTTSALTEVAIGPNMNLEWHIEGGAAFSTGITIMVTGGQGLTNNTAVTAGDVTGFTLHA